MTSRDGSVGRKVWGALVWAMVAFEVVAIGAAGVAKFAAADVWNGLFAGWGYPPGFSYVVGCLEIGGSLTLLVPRLAGYGGVLLLGIMLAALGTVLLHPGSMGPVAPLIHIVVLAVVVRVRWRSRAGAAAG